MRPLVLVALLLLTASARGSTKSAQLIVGRAPSASDCPTAAALADRVETILRAPRRFLTGGGAAEVEVNVRFAKERGVYVARVVFGGARAGERELTERAAACEGLAEAVAVTIALALGRVETGLARDSDDAARERPTTDEPRCASGDDSCASAGGAPARHAEAPWRWSFDLVLEGGPAVSFGSDLSWTWGGKVRALLPGWSFELAVRSILPETVPAGPGQVTTRWLMGEAGVCRMFGGRYTLGPCVSFAGGRLSGQGSGFGDNRSVALTWLAPAAGVALRASGPGSFTWGVSATCWAPLRQLTLSDVDANVLWRSSTFSFALAASTGLHFE